MGRTRGFDFGRAVRYVGAAAALAAAIGAVREGSLVGGLAFGLLVGVGVAVGLVAFELLGGRLTG